MPRSTLAVIRKPMSIGIAAVMRLQAASVLWPRAVRPQGHHRRGNHSSVVPDAAAGRYARHK